MSLPFRRFGRTNLNMPVLSLGSMRFQKSWQQLNISDISKSEQQKVDEIINKAYLNGFNHIETARHYGTSELQLGTAFKNQGRYAKIIQTKIPPYEDAKKFEEELKMSFDKLGVKKIDLVAIHGVNNSVHLRNSLKDGGCIDVLRKWQKNNLVGHIGFSTHGELSLIKKAISSNKFDYVNLHWYFINQKNFEAIELAKKYDLGVFIISPTDKGGHLHNPSEKLLNLCKPLHPIVFNDLFCLKNNDVHTISVGISKLTDFDYHLEAVTLLKEVDYYVPLIEKILTQELINTLGKEWILHWDKNIPNWQDTPGEINIRVLIWLANLIDAFDLISFARARYQLLGNGGHWFPGNNANEIDISISERELLDLLSNHINPQRVIRSLRFLKSKFGDGEVTRLSIV